MKKLLFLTLISLAACNPYAHLKEPVRMNYCVTLEDHGSILCRDYKLYKDSLVLKDAGYWAKPLYQRNTTDIKFVNWPGIMIVKLTK
jgi:hypothetical protein